MVPWSVTVKSSVLSPGRKYGEPGGTVKDVKAPKPGDVSPRLWPLSTMSLPILSVDQVPLSDAVVGSSPLSKKVVRNVRVTLVGPPFAPCHTH